MRESAGTPNYEEAKIIAAKRYNELFNQIKLGEKPKRTWDEAVVKWAKTAKDKRSFNTDLDRLRVLHPHLSGKYLNELTRDFIDEVIEELEDEREWSNASVNRYLSAIRSILRMACEQWEWIDRVPKLQERDEAKKRVRWITEQEARRLIEEVPEHWKWIVIFCLNTGLRKSNLLGLKWSQIDLERRCAWVYGDEAKGKKDITIPLNNDAMSVLRAKQREHPVYVFTYRGSPLTKPGRLSWIGWCKKAGIVDFRVHDMRHTWASWFVQRGGSLHALMELGGWSSYEMVLKYAHHSASSLHDAASIVDSGLTTERK